MLGSCVVLLDVLGQQQARSCREPARFQFGDVLQVLPLGFREVGHRRTIIALWLMVGGMMVSGWLIG